MGKRLYRSRDNKVLAGVCGGIAEYFAFDPTIVRILFVVLSLLPGPGIIAYILAIFIIPERPADYFYGNTGRSSMGSDIGSETDSFKVNADEWKEPARFDSGKSGVLIGAVLIILGIIFFIRQFISWFDMKYLFPVVLIAIGFLIVFKGRRGSF